MESVERRIGGDLFTRSKSKVIVTLPAIWPVHVQPRTCQAISLAGILNDRLARETALSLVPEPKAAALAACRVCAAVLSRHLVTMASTIPVLSRCLTRHALPNVPNAGVHANPARPVQYSGCHEYVSRVFEV